MFGRFLLSEKYCCSLKLAFRCFFFRKILFVQFFSSFVWLVPIVRKNIVAVFKLSLAGSYYKTNSVVVFSWVRLVPIVRKQIMLQFFSCVWLVPLVRQNSIWVFELCLAGSYCQKNIVAVFKVCSNCQKKYCCSL